MKSRADEKALRSKETFVKWSRPVKSVSNTSRSYFQIHDGISWCGIQSRSRCIVIWSSQGGGRSCGLLRSNLSREPTARCASILCSWAMTSQNPGFSAICEWRMQKALSPGHDSRRQSLCEHSGILRLDNDTAKEGLSPAVRKGALLTCQRHGSGQVVLSCRVG